jgi:cysteine synthase A
MNSPSLVSPACGATAERQVVEAVSRRFAALCGVVGNTPLLAIECVWRGRRRTVWAKAEHFNVTGSIKDRMALHVLRRAHERGRLRPGATIVEATSGNTGVALAGIGRALGHRVLIFMPDWMSRERVGLMRSLGAEVRLVAREQGGFLGCIERAEELARSAEDVFLPRQFSNDDNAAAHETTTGPEIWRQMRHEGLEPDAFVAGVGTGGTVMGVGRFLRCMRPSIVVHPLEPKSSPTLSTGHKVGRHRIQGISDDFVPAILDLAALDAVVGVDDGDAIVMAQKLAREIGLGVGISSGANFLGALLVADRLGADARVVTVFPDDNKKYLSTDLVRDEPVRPEFLSSDVRLLGFEAHRCACDSHVEPAACLPRPVLDAVAS